MPRRNVINYRSNQRTSGDDVFVRGLGAFYAAGASLMANILGLLIFWSTKDAIFIPGPLISLFADFLGLVLGVMAICLIFSERKSVRTWPDRLPLALVSVLLSFGCLGGMLWWIFRVPWGGGGMH